MLQVREIMTPHVVTLSADASLRDAIETLVTCRIGGAPVLERGTIVGVLSATDILEFESSLPPATGTDVAESEESEDAGEGDRATAAFFLDLWPSDEHSVAERFAAIEPEWSLLEDHQVSEAMSRSICTVPQDLEVSAAAQQMLASGVLRALVTGSGDVVGILTATDILRAVAERRLSVPLMALA